MSNLSLFRSAFADSGRKRSFYAAYTIVFCVVALFCFWWFIASGRSLIFTNDGWYQHFKALVYYARYLRSILSQLLHEHVLIIPNWDYYIGEGSDILSSLHYYVIGDPIALLAVFVPTRYMHYFYSFSCILRLYLAGLAFSALCFGTEQRSRYGIMAGAVAYCFCSWALTNAARHPNFLNPMIWFPLMILGIEKILRKESPLLFIAASAVAAASNFYFFYMIAILAVFYALVRLGTLYRRDLKKGFLTLCTLGVMALVALCLAGIILLPVLSVFLQESRISVSQPFHWFYPLSYYSQLPSMFVADQMTYWAVMGYSPPVVLAVFLLFLRKKEDGLLKVFFLTGLLILLFPIGGRLLNGMSYMSNRWIWAFALLCTYILVREWDALLSLSLRQWRWLALCCFLYFAACMFLRKSHSSLTLAATVLLFASLIVVREDAVWKRTPALQQLVLLLLAALGTVNVAYWRYSPDAGNYVANTMENGKVLSKWTSDEAALVKSVTEYPYTRFTGRSLSNNTNILKKISSTQYFWSISNPYMNEYRSELAFIDPLFSNYKGYDDRTAPIALAGVQYYTTPKDAAQGLPYGFSFIGTYNADRSLKTLLEDLQKELGTENLTEEQSRKLRAAASQPVSVYKNEYALPIAYCYDACFSEELWDSFDPVQKQEAQLEAAYIKTEAEPVVSAVPLVRPDVPDFRVPFELACSGAEVTRTENGFVATADSTTVTLTLPAAVPNSETYVGFEGLEYTPVARYDLYFGDRSVDPLDLYNRTNWKQLSASARYSIKTERRFWNPVKNADIVVEAEGGATKTISYYQPDANFSAGRHDFIANLGYSEEPLRTITITLPTRGIYSFDSLTVYSIPMDRYPEKIEKLKADTLQDVEFGTDCVTGSITLSDARVLCMAIPYAKGWTAVIDGSETEVFCLNGRYFGVVIPEGSHVVQFRYRTPYRDAGLAVSGFGCAAFAAVLLLDRRKRKASDAAKQEQP